MVGLETYYGPYTPENERELLALAHEYQLIPTGGTDFHGPGIHPTPLGGRYVPFEAVESLKAEAAKRRGKTPPPFELPHRYRKSNTPLRRQGKADQGD